MVDSLCLSAFKYRDVLPASSKVTSAFFGIIMTLWKSNIWCVLILCMYYPYWSSNCPLFGHLKLTDVFVGTCKGKQERSFGRNSKSFRSSRLRAPSLWVLYKALHSFSHFSHLDSSTVIVILGWTLRQHLVVTMLNSRRHTAQVNEILLRSPGLLDGRAMMIYQIWFQGS